jgi:hypothetical protein
LLLLAASCTREVPRAGLRSTQIIEAGEAITFTNLSVHADFDEWVLVMVLPQ